MIIRIRHPANEIAGAVIDGRVIASDGWHVIIDHRVLTIDVTLLTSDVIQILIDCNGISIDHFKKAFNTKICIMNIGAVYVF